MGDNLHKNPPGTVKIGSFTVNRIGLGTNRISDNEASRAVLKRAVELGVNFIDTAARYGLSEQTIGETLAPYPSGVVPGTKGGWSDNNDPEKLEESINRSLELLKLKQLPLWHLHRIDTSVPIEDTMRFLKSQQDAGKILHIGLSEVSVRQIEAARKIVPVVSIQNRYNIEDRQHEPVVDYCTREKITFLPYYPLSFGSLGTNHRLNEIARKYSATPYQIAIAWLLKRSPIMLPIPGTLSIEHLESNVAAGKINLSDQDYKYLT